jgi:hypothetical protein
MTVAADLYIPFSGGASGDMATVANLGSGTRPANLAGGSWDLNHSPLSGIKVLDMSHTVLPYQPLVGGVTYTDPGTRVLQYDHSKYANGEWASYWFATPRPSSVTVEFMFLTNADPLNYNGYALARIQGSDYIIWGIEADYNSNGFTFIAHSTNHFSSSTVRVQPNHWYRVAMRYVQNGLGSVAMFDGTTGAQVGSTITAAIDDGNYPAYELDIGRMGGDNGITPPYISYYASPVINWTTAPFPLYSGGTPPVGTPVLSVR